jgi:hypothetical protein
MSQDSNDIKIAVLQNQMNNVEKKVDDGFAGIERLIQEQSDKMDARMDDKANKWVENAVKFFVGSVAVIIIGAVMARILIK